MVSEKVTDVIRRYKDNTDPEQRFARPIRDEEGHDLGTLSCLDRAWARDPEIITALTDWRTRFKRYFCTQFQATAERTASWLEKVVFSNDDEILFLICAETGDVVGNIAVSDLTETHGSVGNMIRGRKGGHPKLLYYAGISVLAWMFGPLGIQDINVFVLSNNKRALNFNLNIGFTHCASHPMTRVATDEEIRLLVNSDEGEPVDITYEDLYMDRAAFLSHHPWAARVYPGL